MNLRRLGLALLPALLVAACATSAPTPAKFGAGGLVGGGGIVKSVRAGTNVTVDSTDPYNPKVSSTGGGGGGTIHTSAPLSGDGSVGTPATIAAGALPLSAIANQSDLTINCNNAGVSGPPLACTAAQARTVLNLAPVAQSGSATDLSLGTLAAARLPAFTGDVTSPAGSNVNTIAAGAVTLADMANLANQTVIGNGSGGSAVPAALALTNANGIVATASALVNTYKTGVSGGQTVYGDTASGGTLTLRADFAGVDGIIAFGATTTMRLTEQNFANGPQLSMGTATPQSNCVFEGSHTWNTQTLIAVANPGTTGASQAGFFAAQRNDLSLVSFQFVVNGSGYTTSGIQVAGGGYINLAGGSGNMLFQVGQAAGDFYWFTGASATQKMHLSNAGNLTFGTGLATTAVDGFLYIPSGAGPPTGVPTSPTLDNNVPTYIDRTNHKLYMYIGGWLGSTTPGAFN